jgi:hypothetical protein
MDVVNWTLLKVRLSGGDRNESTCPVPLPESLIFRTSSVRTLTQFGYTRSPFQSPVKTPAKNAGTPRNKMSFEERKRAADIKIRPRACRCRQQPIPLSAPPKGG